MKKKAKNGYKPAVKTVCRCPICGGKLQKESSFYPSDHRHGEAQPKEVAFRPYPGAQKITRIEKPQGNGDKKLTIYKCSACHIGWKPKDVIRERISPGPIAEMTAKEYKALINSPEYSQRFISVLG